GQVFTNSDFGGFKAGSQRLNADFPFGIEQLNDGAAALLGIALGHFSSGSTALCFETKGILRFRNFYARYRQLPDGEGQVGLRCAKPTYGGRKARLTGRQVIARTWKAGGYRQPGSRCGSP